MRVVGALLTQMGHAFAPRCLTLGIQPFHKETVENGRGCVLANCTEGNKRENSLQHCLKPFILINELHRMRRLGQGVLSLALPRCVCS